jgi:hypothetical protein
VSIEKLFPEMHRHRLFQEFPTLDMTPPLAPEHENRTSPVPHWKSGPKLSVWKTLHTMEGEGVHRRKLVKGAAAPDR